MTKEFFSYSETRQLFQTLEEITRRSNVSRAQAFEDTIRASVAALAAETMEPEYFEAIKAHTKGEIGKRGVDLMPVFLAQTVDAMSRTDNDVLGDLFQGCISYGEHSLYLTPPSVAQLMAKMTIDETEDGDNRDTSISDPCCGSGIPLIEAGKLRPKAELVGQDIDARCARLAAINLGLRQKYGWIICGNTLTSEVQFVYRIGSFFHKGPQGRRRGVIREVPPEQCPVLPELQHHTKQSLLDTLDEESFPNSVPEQNVPQIIEIPDWVLRLEQCHALQEQSEEQQNSPIHRSEENRAEGDLKTDTAKPQKPSPENDDEPPKTQQALF
ncbi:N-6 DNA Methylase [Gimesia alba]|uniref:site-specific DNA-methyltransferase (adenine-specific) n=1 Tax=Gimesia alba TaxID=2527973 RepID=A0A517RHY3_9PLAN|nr:N-6 DNA methylase [Gimesia alba]QDT43484.1 N-6 DNA Methylase [Gimesia alba]